MGVAADPRSGSVSMRLRLVDEDTTLRPGMYAEAVVPTGGGERIMQIPSSAVRRTQPGQALVQILASNHVFSREIGIAESGTGDTVEVTSGIEEDTVILVQHSPQIQQGERVHALFPSDIE